MSRERAPVSPVSSFDASALCQVLDIITRVIAVLTVLLRFLSLLEEFLKDECQANSK